MEEVLASPIRAALSFENSLSMRSKTSSFIDPIYLKFAFAILIALSKGTSGSFFSSSTLNVEIDDSNIDKISAFLTTLSTIDSISFSSFYF